MSLASRLNRLDRLIPTPRPANPLARYARDPYGYAREVLHREWWGKQQEIAQLLLTPPYRVLVKACHSVGKTFLAGSLVNWWYDTRDPGVVISTAPTAREVRDLLWAEVRNQRGPRGGWAGDRSPELWSAPFHYAKGYTAAKHSSFQGRHPPNLFFIFDEAIGVEDEFWTVTESMFRSDGQDAWLCLFNPTDSGSRAAYEERRGGWHVVTLDAREHPNLSAELAGRPPPFPTAVRLSQFTRWVERWCDPIGPEDVTATDIEWPPGSGQWYRPGPLMESRGLGRYPSQALYTVWSDALWTATQAVRHEVRPHWSTQIGCDVARFGDDDTTIYVRRGAAAVHAERHNGWPTDRTAGRLKELCFEWHAPGQRPIDVPCVIDSCGLGAGLVDQGAEFNFVGVNVAEVAQDIDRYADRRSELWFVTVELARARLIDVSRLPAAIQQELGRQLQAPKYTVTPAGRLQVESKEKTKARIKQSPDEADGFNLSFVPVPASRGMERLSGRA